MNGDAEEWRIADLLRSNVAASPTANCPRQSISNLSNQIHSKDDDDVKKSGFNQDEEDDEDDVEDVVEDVDEEDGE